jgi:HIRAN domain
MSFLDRLLGKQTAQVPVTWPAMVLVPTGLDPMSSGRNKSMRGFFIRDANTDRGISHEELSELVPGAVVFNVAGTSHRQDALQGPAFAPGEPVKLIPEPKNPYDRNAVAVWDTNRRAHVGYVPAELAPTIGRIFRGGQPFGATVFFEFLQGKRRMALSVLVAPAAFLQTLRIEDEEDA